MKHLALLKEAGLVVTSRRGRLEGENLKGTRPAGWYKAFGTLRRLPQLLSGIKTLLETGETLTTPRSLRWLQTARDPRTPAPHQPNYGLVLPLPGAVERAIWAESLN
jgi:hypothetical protein